MSGFPANVKAGVPIGGSGAQGLPRRQTQCLTAWLHPRCACRETALRQESLRKFDALSELLDTKDKMIWKLLKEREAGTADLDKVAKASAGELQEWKR